VPDAGRDQRIGGRPLRGTITPGQLQAITVMAIVTGALAAWIGFAAGTGRWAVAAASSVLCLAAALILSRIAWSVIGTLETETPTSIPEESQ
jgi:hypothetical protein